MASYQSFETTYVRMVVEANEIHWKYNTLASAAHWTLLAGYLVLPGTFTSLRESSTIDDKLYNAKAGRIILNTIQNPPLLGTAFTLFTLGLIVMGRLYWQYKSNYIWLINKLLM